jgi:hypothetical protein
VFARLSGRGWRSESRLNRALRVIEGSIERRKQENEKRIKIWQLLHKAVTQSPVSLDKIRPLVEAWDGVLCVAGVNGNLALHDACGCGAPMEVIRYLVQEYRGSLYVANTYLKLPIHHACSHGVPLLEIIQYLVHEYPESLRTTAKNGFLPLHYACSCNRGSPLEIIRYLVQEFPESLQVTSNDGNLPLHHACNIGAPLNVIRFLVNEYPESLQFIGNDGKRPLDLAWNQEVVAWMESATLGGIEFTPLSSAQPSVHQVQPTNHLFSTEEKTRIHRIDIDPPVSSQQPLLQPLLHPTKRFNKESSQQPLLQPLLKPTERFSEEVSTEDRNEEGAADFKRMLEEMS